MVTDLTITVPDELRDAVQSTAEADGKTVDTFAVEALQKQIARRFLDRMKREAQGRRGSMTDEQVEEVVDRAIP